MMTTPMASTRNLAGMIVFLAGFSIAMFSDLPGREAHAADKAEPKRTQKTTDVSFEDVLVQGKYHFSDEAVTTVEDDKVLDALLGVRTDFKDRLKKSAARH